MISAWWLLLALWIGGALGAISAWLAEDKGSEAWLSEPPIVIGGALIWPFASIYAIAHIRRFVRKRNAKLAAGRASSGGPNG